MNLLKECAALLDKVREQSPLVHHLTNSVTINDCANVSLAVGASPIMAPAIEEAADIAAISSALVLNIGTLTTPMIESMLAAGKSANAHNRPVVFDPVGAGASALRNAATARILGEVKVAVLRGNVSEIRHVGGFASHTKGVDASRADQDIDAGRVVFDLAGSLSCVVAATGKVDAVSDGERTVRIENGNAAMARVSGTGCMCTSLVGCFVGAAPENAFVATVAAILCMGVAGEIAFARAGELGTGSYHHAIIDAVSLMRGDMMTEMGRLHETNH